VLVCDNGHPRNEASQAMHGYLTRDGMPPLEFLRLARGELTPYDTVEIRDATVVDALCADSRFVTTLQSGERVRSRKLLIATGVRDRVPDIEGIAGMYGLYGRGERGYGLSLELTGWSRDLVLTTDGPCELDERHRRRLQRAGIRLREDRVARLEGENGILRRIVFAEGEPLERRAMFFTTGQYQQSELAVKLGCEFNDKGTVRTGKYESTHLPGLFVCGDASRAVQWVVVAASEGAEAAFAINTDLIKEDLASAADSYDRH
jgi:thioredoxin reductase